MVFNLYSGVNIKFQNVLWTQSEKKSPSVSDGYTERGKFYEMHVNELMAW